MAFSAIAYSQEVSATPQVESANVQCGGRVWIAVRQQSHALSTVLVPTVNVTISTEPAHVTEPIQEKDATTGNAHSSVRGMEAATISQVFVLAILAGNLLIALKTTVEPTDIVFRVPVELATQPQVTASARDFTMELRVRISPARAQIVQDMVHVTTSLVYATATPTGLA